MCSCIVTVILIFDGEAEDVASPEARAVIHPTIEKRMRVGVLNVQNLTSCRHVAGNALIGWDAKLILCSDMKTHTVLSLLNSSQDRETISKCNHINILEP